MDNYILDASALLALLNDEKGADIVKEVLPQSVISNVNLAEVVSRLSAIGMPEKDIREILSMFGLQAVTFDEEQAFGTGLLFAQGRITCLSLGDRACLTLARLLDATAVTADKAWADLSLGVNINLIR